MVHNNHAFPEDRGVLGVCVVFLDRDAEAAVMSFKAILCASSSQCVLEYVVKAV